MHAKSTIRSASEKAARHEALAARTEVEVARSARLHEPAWVDPADPFGLNAEEAAAPTLAERSSSWIRTKADGQRVAVMSEADFLSLSWEDMNELDCPIVISRTQAETDAFWRGYFSDSPFFQ